MIQRFAVLLILAGVAAPAGAAEFRVGPVPPWVQRLPLPSPATGTHERRMLLDDEQIRFAARSEERYVHWAHEISDENMLQADTQLAVSYDPTYESVTLHAVTAIRNGQRLDRLRPAAIKVVQREPNLEAQMYDGRRSLVLFVEDLRVGDVLDVEYTVRGADPTLAGHVSELLVLGASVPVARAHGRIIVPAERTLEARAFGPGAAALNPKIGWTPQGREYVWDEFDVPAHPVEPLRPSWDHPLPTVIVSDFKGWSEVAAWAATLMHVPATPARALVTAVERLWAHASSQRAFALAATRFVQDQIRYVALETGLSRRRATNPEVVLARRFGDCKDKSVLLATLLRLGGIDAEPALVSTGWRDHLGQALPSAGAFDHVIVHVPPGPVAGDDLWIDATASL